MPKFFTAQGRTFMEVHPVESLQNSTMVKSVLKRGDKFVVDMNTGKLTVYSHPKDEKPVLAIVISFPDADFVPVCAKTAAQAIYHSNDYINRWGVCNQLIMIAFGDNKVSLTRNENSVQADFERTLKLLVADVTGASV